MKLLFSGNTAWSMYNFRKHILSDCINKGHEVYVIAPSDSIYDKLIEKIGCKFIHIEIERKGTNPLRDFFLYLTYIRFIKEIKPDGCFFYTIKPNIYGGMAASYLNIPFIPITTGLGYIFTTDSIVNKIAKYLYKVAFKKAKQVWFLNQDDKSSFIENKIISQEKVKILKGEGIDLSNFEVKENISNDLTFLLLARMLWDKGVGIYVDAAAEIKKIYPNVKFQLLGAIDKENPMGISKSQIIEWHNKGYIEYLGKTDDVRPYIYNSDCIVLPSYYREGIPFCLMEGAAAGKPLITTNNTGCREVVENNYNGFLCKTKDVNSLIEVIKKMIELPPSERIQMGLNGRKKIESEFNIELIKAEYIQAINLFFN